jgi:F-type H+-transporting ATPase subunit b
MELDWITVAAQIINFLVLVWLLQRFLYGPIVRAMDEREARLAESLREAQQDKETAEAEAKHYREMQETFERQQEERLAIARKEADGLLKSLQADARKKVAAERTEWLKNLADEKADFLSDIQDRSAEAFAAMARRALADLANAKLEDQIARRFLVALRELDERDLKKIKTAYARTGATVAARTAFDLPARRRNEIKAALRDALGKDVDVAFEQSPNLICGIELRVGGQMVRWSLDSFLDDLEHKLKEAIENRAPESERRAAE